jgi:hypothetical protein
MQEWLLINDDLILQCTVYMDPLFKTHLFFNSALYISQVAYHNPGLFLIVYNFTDLYCKTENKKESLTHVLTHILTHVLTHILTRTHSYLLYLRIAGIIPRHMRLRMLRAPCVNYQELPPVYAQIFEPCKSSCCGVGTIHC